MNSINQGFLNDRCTRKVFLLALGQVWNKLLKKIELAIFFYIFTIKNNPKFALKMLSSLKRMRQDKMLSMRVFKLLFFCNFLNAKIILIVFLYFQN
jgi:hypothetical protein